MAFNAVEFVAHYFPWHYLGAPLAIIELLRPAAFASARAGRCKTGAGALPDDRSLQLGERRGDMEDKRAHRRRRVDRLGERDEFDAAVAELIDEGY
jgi:hypothetical protein